MANGTRSRHSALVQPGFHERDPNELRLVRGESCDGAAFAPRAHPGVLKALSSLYLEDIGGSLAQSVGEGLKRRNLNMKVDKR